MTKAHDSKPKRSYESPRLKAWGTLVDLTRDNGISMINDPTKTASLPPLDQQ